MERKYLKDNNGFVARNSITVTIEQSSPYYYYSKSQKNGITASANNSTDGLILLESSRGQTNCFVGQEQKQLQQHNGQPECIIKDKTSKRTYASNLYEKSGERHSESYQSNFGFETALYPSWIGNTAARENQKISQIQKIYNNSIIHRSRLNQNVYPNNGINYTGHNQSKNKSPVQFFNIQSNNTSNTASQQEKNMEAPNFTDNAENQKFLRTQLSQILPQSPHKNCNQPLRKYYSSQHMSQGVGQQQGSSVVHFPKDECSSLWNNQNYKSNCSSSSVISHDQSNESGMIYFKQKENNNDFQKIFLSKQIRKKEIDLGNQETVPNKQILESTFEQFKILPQAQISPLVLPPPPQKRLTGGVLDSSRRAKDKHKNSAGFLGIISPNSKFYSTEPHFNKQILKRLQGGDSKLSGKPQLSPISQSKIISSDQYKKDQLTGQPSKKLIPTDIEDNNNNKNTKQSQKQESKESLLFFRQTKSQFKQEEHEDSNIIQERQEESIKPEQQIDQKTINSMHSSSEEQVNQQSISQNKHCQELEIDVNYSGLQNKSKGETQVGLLALASNRQSNQLEIIEQETKEIPAELWEQVRAISEARPKTSGGGKRRLKMHKQMEQKQVRSNQDIEEQDEFRDECQKQKQQKPKKIEEITFGEKQQRELDLETSKQSKNNQKVSQRQQKITEEEYANCSGDFEENLKEDSGLGKMGRKQKHDMSYKFNKTHQGEFFGQSKRESENVQIELSRLSPEQGKQEKLFNLHKKITKVTNNIERESTQDQQKQHHNIIIRHTKTAASTTRVQKHRKSQQDDVIAREIVKFETGLDSEFIQLFASQKLL